LETGKQSIPSRAFVPFSSRPECSRLNKSRSSSGQSEALGSRARSRDRVKRVLPIPLVKMLAHDRLSRGAASSSTRSTDSRIPSGFARRFCDVARGLGARAKQPVEKLEFSARSIVDRFIDSTPVRMTDIGMRSRNNYLIQLAERRQLVADAPRTARRDPVDEITHVPACNFVNGPRPAGATREISGSVGGLISGTTSERIGY